MTQPPSGRDEAHTNGAAASDNGTSENDTETTEIGVDAERFELIENSDCVVVKVGTRVLTRLDGTLDRDRVDKLAAGLCAIADTGRHTIMVSSGAVGAGVAKLGLTQRPTGISKLQAVAAVGQADLIQAYQASFAMRGRHAAQVLLTTNDLKRRSGYLHVRNALLRIHDFGAIAVVNENDSVAVGELRTTFGDNDRLAAHVAGLLGDALLIILSDIDGLYDRAPTDPGSKLIKVVDQLDEAVREMASDEDDAVSKGGMTGKLKAAQLATSHGHAVIIGPGRVDDVLQRIVAGESIGTLFTPAMNSLRGRRRWIGSAAESDGTVFVDKGAAKVIAAERASLLAVGITRVTGAFKRGAVLSIVDPQGNEIARGLSNYKSSELAKIKGLSSDKIAEAIGHCHYETVIHSDNMAPTNALP